MPQTDKFEFAELNIVHKSILLTLTLVKRAIVLGYDTVAINIDIGEFMITEDEVDEPVKKKRKKGAKFKSVPEPFKVDESKLDLSPLLATGKKFRQYSRLTVDITCSGAVHSLATNRCAQQFDIIAVRPATEQLLTSLTNKAEFIDLITFAADEKVSWLCKSKLLLAAVDRGISLELIFGMALNDSSARTQMLANGRQLLSTTRRGRGVILSSGAESVLQLRAPYDVANLVTLFGAKPQLGRQLVSVNAKKVLLKSDAKKTLKGAIFIESICSPSDIRLEKLLAIPEFRTQVQIMPPSENPSKST